MHASIKEIRFPKRCTNARANLAVLALNKNIERHFQYNGLRDVYIDVRWSGNCYIARARYVVPHSGGQHMTIASAFE